MIGLFFGGNAFKTRFESDFGNIELDANLEETHDWAAEATVNPVENGAAVTDHIIDMPDKLTLRGLVSDSPITISDSLVGLFNISRTNTRTQPVFDLLYTLLKSKQSMTVYTKHRNYDDMVITSVNIPRDASKGETLEFVVEFLNIRKVSTQVVDIPPGIGLRKTDKTSEALGNKAEPQKDAGKKQPENKPRQSIIDGIIDRLFG